MSRHPRETRFDGWTPSKRDLFEQWLCNQVLEKNLDIPIKQWPHFVEEQYREWKDMLKEIGPSL
jgi:hypothetical protein